MGMGGRAGLPRGLLPVKRGVLAIPAGNY
jgi:hypothetical protein